MDTCRLLMVEDNAQDLQICRDSVAKYKDDKSRTIDLVECKTVDEAFHKLDKSFDGAIIDLKLNSQGDEGTQVIRRIKEFQCRIPIAIMTATPGSADHGLAEIIGIYKKGEIEYTQLFDTFWGIYNTGLTRIMGGRGEIEQTLNEVFIKNLLPKLQRDKWVEYGQIDSARAEKALLRHVLNHLLQIMDNDEVKCFPEEVYIYPPLVNSIKTGSIVKRKSDSKYFVVLNPACDLVVRPTGFCKTDHILLVDIEQEAGIIGEALNGITSKEKKEKRLQNVLGNNNNDYQHWLPKTNFFHGGFLNFRTLITLEKVTFDAEYNPPDVQISPPFVKDIVSRFSSYYARQGQPDIDFKGIVERLVP